jgi:hypothetical protein
LSVACFERKTKIERQVFHLMLILSFYAYNILVNWTRFRRVLGLLLFAVSLVALVWSLWPLPVQTRSLAISPAEMLPTELVPGTTGGLPAVAEHRFLILEWPLVIRSGDPASIRLVFGPAGQEGSFAQLSPMAGEASSVLAEARLELSDILHTPMGEVSQGLLPGRPAIFVWELRPNRAGDANGTVWLHLRFIPVAGGSALRQVLTAQRIEIRVIEFLGLSGPWARALGSAGVVVGAVLGLDGAALWLWRRLDESSRINLGRSSV